MPEPKVSARRLQFSAFEFDPDSRQLTKRGLRLKVSGQPMEILALLLEKPGEVVTREEIRQRLWEDDTFVDFEHSLNAAVNKLREILGDDSLRPRFVETVPRRGYRFVGEIEHEPEKEVIPAPAMVTPTPKALPSRRILAVAGALVLVGVSAWMLLRSGHPEAFQIISNRQLTTTPGLATSPTFSPDGRQMAYAMDRGHGNEIFIRQVSPGGVELQLTSDGQQNVDPSWSPNGETVAYHAIKGKGIWLIPGLGGAPRRVTDFGSRPRWSADGQWLAFQSGDTTDLSAVNPGAFPPSTIWVVRQDGTGLRQVTQSGRPEGGHGQPSWSPDSRHIIFTSTFYGAATVDTVDLQTGTTTQIAPTSSFYVDPTYSPDGQYVFFGGTSATNETALWQMKISPKTSRPEGSPKVLLYGRIRHLQVAKDGKKILYTSVQASSSLESLALDKNLSPSGNVKTLRTDVGCRVTVPRISPDGKSIAFNLCWEGAATQV
ncbi:MAG TPA: winged helix-turn-helix domain-containing protein, partial [Terriglobales bacterium]